MTVPNWPISREDQSALKDLQFHWDTAYNITFDGDTWSAAPLCDAATVLTAESASELRELMRRDYQEHDRRNWREPWHGCSLW
jgi:hypothetical protein